MSNEQNGSTSLMSVDQTLAVQDNVSLGVMALKERMDLVAHVISQMIEGVHYGPSFPGDKKKNLLKPGADYLGVSFRLVPEFMPVITHMDNGHREYMTTCQVLGPNGKVVGNGVGSCSTMESKYRWRHAKIKCPNCQAEAVMKGKPEYSPKGEDGKPLSTHKEGGWLCWKNNKTSPGCGMTWGDSDPSIVHQERGKIENMDPADQWNTCLKISKKRAYVDAMITCTGCSDKFTQDAEDMLDHSTPPPATPAQAAAPAQTPPKAATPPAQPKEQAPPAANPAPQEQQDQATLAGKLQKTQSLEQLNAVWNEILAVQATLPGSALVQLNKVKRAVETSLKGGN